jgi:hypothetical protein
MVMVAGHAALYWLLRAIVSAMGKAVSCKTATCRLCSKPNVALAAAILPFSLAL